MGFRFRDHLISVLQSIDIAHMQSIDKFFGLTNLWTTLKFLEINFKNLLGKLQL